MRAYLRRNTGREAGGGEGVKGGRCSSPKTPAPTHRRSLDVDNLARVEDVRLDVAQQRRGEEARAGAHGVLERPRADGEEPEVDRVGRRRVDGRRERLVAL